MTQGEKEGRFNLIMAQHLRIMDVGLMTVGQR